MSPPPTNLQSSENKPPLCGERWAAKAEAYAVLISQCLTAETVWLDAGCGKRLLESDLDPLEDWLAAHCRCIVGMDVSLTTHRNIRRLVRGSLYNLPFGNRSLDLVTCNMVVEHLEQPTKAFAEIARCLKPGGALIIHTPNLMNYAVMGNAIASRIVPEKWRLRLIQGMDGRQPEDFFPVRYKANTAHGLSRLLTGAGFEVCKLIPVRQRNPFFRKTQALERLLIKLTPNLGLLVCARKLPM